MPTSDETDIPTLGSADTSSDSDTFSDDELSSSYS